LGKYVVNRFGKIGSKCILPHRGDEVDVRHLKLAGDLGVINPVESSIRSLADIEEAVAESNVVVNLCGKHFETMRWSFADVNTTFPAVLAQVCADAGVERLVHVSALDASVDSPSAWARSKALGEREVREAFPSATILRPATIFGDEDKFLNRIAKLSQVRRLAVSPPPPVLPSSPERPPFRSSHVLTSSPPQRNAPPVLSDAAVLPDVI
jgi:NADH dehydrogenase (ubiquinone) 1 alpha subcomplex subunit 9